MSEPIKLSISVVVYKPDQDLLCRSLESLRASVDYARAALGISAHFQLVDNSCDEAQPALIQSTMNVALRGESMNLLVSDANDGYGAGNNKAIAKADSKYHIVANPDIFPDEDAIFQACQYMSCHPEVVMITPAVRGEDNQTHYLCKQNPSLFIMFLRSFAPSSIRKKFEQKLYRFEMRDHDYDKDIDNVDYPTGCFMFFRTAILKEINGFDEDFFMYLEDADIGRRAGKLGKVRYVPSVRVVHQWARGTHKSWRLRWVTIQSAFIYWKKWGGFFSGSR